MRSLRHAGAAHFASRGVDLGDEPALSIVGDAPERLQLSLRWLAGTVLTGVAGTALMGGALLAAVDGETRLARDPSMAGPNTIHEIVARGTPASRRGDRLPPRIVEHQTRRIVQIATTTRIGDREIVRTRPFARVQAQLALQRTSVSANIPAFNPLRIFNEAGTPSPAPPPSERDLDGEMTVRTLPMSDALGQYADEDRIGAEHVLALARQTLLVETALTQANPAAPIVAGQQRVVSPADLLAAATTLGFAQADGPRLNEEFSFRVVNENVTQIIKTRAETRAQQAAPSDETTHIVQRGETLATILVSNGASLEESRSIIEAITSRFRPNDLREGHRLRLVLAPSENDPSRRSISRVAILMDRTVLATAVLTEVGRYAAIDMTIDTLDEPANQAEEGELVEEETAGATPSLYVSIYETALRNGVPRTVIDELIKIYSYDVEFQRRVRPGDTFEVFYAAEEETGGTPGRDDILYASLTVNGETRRYYRFRTEDDGLVDFFDERGRSAKKFLMRTPITGGTFRGGYGMRRHPLLGFTRMHTGVDWSAPIGTPVMAAGAGVVIKADWTSGYGRRIEIQHSNGYVTTYNHLNGFGRNIQRGTRVTQGQIVGFLGSSGLSTGPHLHYEVMVNGSFVDPMRIRVPRGRVLEGRMLAEYERERLRVEQMMRRASPQIARIGN